MPARKANTSRSGKTVRIIPETMARAFRWTLPRHGAVARATAGCDITVGIGCVGFPFFKLLCGNALFFFRCGMLHVHVDAANVKFIQHLGESFLLCLLAFRLVDPTDIVVLLIRGAVPVSLHKAVFIQCVLNKFRHWMSGSLQTGKIITHRITPQSRFHPVDAIASSCLLCRFKKCNNDRIAVDKSSTVSGCRAVSAAPMRPG